MFEIGENEVDHWQMGVGLFHITRAPLETSLHQDRLSPGTFMSHLEGPKNYHTTQRGGVLFSVIE
jgi:hypothetical protein